MPHAARVLIVGAGPTGLAMALALARQGVHCRIIDRAPAPATQSRAIAIQPRTLELFQLLGVVDDFTRCGQRLDGVSIYGHTRERLAHIGFTELPSAYPYVLTLAQHETERILASALLRAGVTVEREITLATLTQDDAGVTATLTTRDGNVATCRVDWVLGCDGAHSTVREALGLPFSGKTYDLRFLLADVAADTTLPPREARIAAAEDGLLGVFPLPGGRVRLAADNPPLALASAPHDPTLDELRAIVARRAPRPLHLEDLCWSSYFRIHSRMVERLRDGRVFLLGDAAHIHSPALGQGMNTGIQDAINLAWKLALVLRRAADASLLASYEAERLPVERAVLRETGLLTTMMATTNPVVRRLREMMLPLLAGLHAVQRSAPRVISELEIAYRDSPIVEEHAVDGGPHAGDRAPEARLVVQASGREGTLYDRLAHAQHTLLALTGPEPSAETVRRLVAIVRAVRAQHGDCVLPALVLAPLAAAARTTPLLAESLIDAHGEVGAQYGDAPALYLVRPDGYIAFRAPLARSDLLFGYLDLHFVATRP